ncbi:hypothetical protein BO70DRAFT_359501 [Aspergillus heteromorphus CBS 117.55]|uniref:F-box domain protein n=1 Tax=Aspergillus heteromorphus CBS 117.55 TaxID=1448321 RepID=A0A317WRY9_9EURO|nr:uncharacterized protein BO70DRAFT_359501 [Aspergillus heteromorphus CBS 117.55]PWY89216.1 hypothetical protein BO70DRAFT_359501 [Aspergillus heteromorphus CBS 117.55]
MSLQSRALHSLCDMKTREKYHQVRISHADGIDHAFDMLMEILKRPSLGQYVRHIDCRAHPLAYKDYVESKNIRQIKDEHMQLLENATRRAGFTGSQEGRIMNMLLQETTSDPVYIPYRDKPDTSGVFVPQALAALLISVSPNLDSMTLTLPFSGWSGLYWPELRGDIELIKFPLEQLLRETNADPNDKPWLQNLRKIYIVNEANGVWDDERFYHRMDFFGALTLFDRLPSIESVGTDLLEWDDNGKQSLELVSSSFSDISINHASLSGLHLAQVICSCKALRKFQFSIGGRATRDGGYPGFSAKTFIKAILTHKETLEVLDMDIDSHIVGFTTGADEESLEYDFEMYDNRAEGEEDNAMPLPEAMWTQAGSLNDFRSLKRLSMGVGFLLYFAKGVMSVKGVSGEKVMLVDRLPENLEYLCIRGYEKGANPEHDNQIDALMELVQMGSSKLKQVEGVDQLIPHGEDVDNPDNNPHLLWDPEGSRSESDLDESETEDSG